MVAACSALRSASHFAFSQTTDGNASSILLPKDIVWLTRLSHGQNSQYHEDRYNCESSERCWCTWTDGAFTSRSQGWQIGSFDISCLEKVQVEEQKGSASFSSGAISCLGRYFRLAVFSLDSCVNIDWLRVYGIVHRYSFYRSIQLLAMYLTSFRCKSSLNLK